MIRKKWIFAAAMIIASLGGSFILGKSISDMKRQARYVEVRGLAEKEVKADSAVWIIPVTTAHDNLTDAQAKTEADIAKILFFLGKYGITADEVSRKSVRVSDKLLQLYMPDNGKDKPRYIIDAELIVRTEKVDGILKASQDTSALLNEGVTITNNDGPKFFFTKLNDIKPALLAESVKQARRAAEEFATNSGSKVGKIKSASQGVISILSKEAAGSSNQSYIVDELGFVGKTVRVVSSIQYYLED